MSSSTSSSEPPMLAHDHGQSAAWGRFLRVFAGCALVLGLGVVAGLVALDPYGSGQPLSLRQKPSDSLRAPRLNPRLAAASRISDARFGGVIVGNSHSQLLNPARLGEQSGIPFASLSMPGTASKEQLAVLDWISHRRTAENTPLQAVVMVLDDWWCSAQGPYQTDHPFPYWLYSQDPVDYVQGLLRWESLEAAGGKLSALFSPGRASGERADGFMDYEAEMVDDRAAILARLQAPLNLAALGDEPPPAAHALRQALGQLPASTAVVLVMTPVYAPALPAPESLPARRLERCKAAFAQVVADRPHSAWLDLMVDDPQTRDSGLFWDTTHYRSALSLRIESALAARLRLLQAESPHHDPPTN